MNRLQRPRDTEYPDASPAQRIEAARRKINMAIWFLKGQLRDLAKEAKAYEKKRVHWTESYARSLIVERKQDIVLHSAKIFRELGELRLAVVDLTKPPPPED